MATFRTLDGEVVVTMNPLAVQELMTSPAGPVVRHMLVDGEKVRQRALQLVPRRTGNLAAHILKRLVLLGGAASVIVGVENVRYAYWVHEGTPPHLIYPRNAPRLVFRGRDGTLVFMPVGAPVHHPGTKPTKFLTRALEILHD